MRELLRGLLEQYLAPAVVQTELSYARTPSYAVAGRGERLESRDVTGAERRRSSLAVNLRHCAVSESDRRQAYRTLYALGQWLEGLTRETLAALPDGAGVCSIEAGLPSFNEAFDDGSAAWSMSVEMIWEKSGKEVRYGD